MNAILINPISRFIEFVFLRILSLLNNEGVSLIVLSMVINILLLPLYFIAEKVEKNEKDIQMRMKPKIDEFKGVYKGYELYLYTSNVYRINKYHPMYALRGLVSLLIQVPFFMGAYQFLAGYQGFSGLSFLFINDLSKPDALLLIGNISVNILPLLMTGINLWAGYIYTKNGTLTEKITIVAIGILFLIILYDSPSALLIYWTFNNVFSLIKNMITYHNSERRLMEEN